MSDEELYDRVEQLEAVVVILAQRALKDPVPTESKLRRFIAWWQQRHAPPVGISIQSVVRRIAASGVSTGFAEPGGVSPESGGSLAGAGATAQPGRDHLPGNARPG